MTTVVQNCKENCSEMQCEIWNQGQGFRIQLLKRLPRLKSEVCNPFTVRFFACPETVLKLMQIWWENKST